MGGGKGEGCRWRDGAERCRATRTEAEANGNGNLHVGCRRARAVDARSTASPAEAGIARRLRLCPGTWNRGSGRINFVVDDAFAVTEYYILQ